MQKDRRGLLESAARYMLFAFDKEELEAGMVRTPERFASFFLDDNQEDPKELLKSAIIEESYQGMVVENGLSFYSLCEHHLVPFFGEATIGYIPNGRLIGLSKLPRVLRAIATGPNLQERITDKVADLIEEVLEPKGVGVILTATHLCMSARGVKIDKAKTTTSSVRGIFKEAGATARAEFLRLSSGHDIS